MFGINTYNIATIQNYGQAHAFFNEAHYPARSKKWLPHQRPLRNTSSPHLRIEKGEHLGLQYYDLVLYQTPLVRYFEPNADGEQAVWLKNHYTNSSQRFLWNARWWDGKKMVNTEGREFPLQLSGQLNLARNLWDDEFTCKLVMTAGGCVIESKSAHIPFARKRSTATHRAKRKQLRESMAMLFDMMEMQYQSFISDIEIDEYQGRPFTLRATVGLKATTAEQLRKADFASLTPDEMTELVHFSTKSCHKIAASIVNRRAYNYPTPSQTSWQTNHEMADRGDLPKHGMALSAHSKEVQAVLTPTWDDISKALNLDLLYAAGLADGDDYVPYPQFASQVARKRYYLHAGGTSHEDLWAGLGEELYCKLTNRKGKVY